MLVDNYLVLDLDLRDVLRLRNALQSRIKPLGVHVEPSLFEAFNWGCRSTLFTLGEVCHIGYLLVSLQSRQLLLLSFLELHLFILVSGVLVNALLKLTFVNHIFEAFVKIVAKLYFLPSHLFKPGVFIVFIFTLILSFMYTRNIPALFDEFGQILLDLGRVLHRLLLRHLRSFNLPNIVQIDELKHLLFILAIFLFRFG